MADQYYEAHCGCLFLPCEGGVMQHPLSNFRQHRFRTDATSRTLPFRPHPANAPYHPLGRIGEDQEMGDSTSLARANGSYNMSAGEGPSSSNTTRNQAAYGVHRHDSNISQLIYELSRWTVDRGINNTSYERRVQPLATHNRQEADLLSNLLDINHTRTQRRPVIQDIDNEPAESVHELGPSSGTSRRRRHAVAFEGGERESPLHEPRHRRIYTGSRPARQDYPGNYQPSTVEDAPDSPPRFYIRRRTNEAPSTEIGNLPRRWGGAALYCTNCRGDRIGNRLPPRVRAGSGRFRGGGP